MTRGTVSVDAEMLLLSEDLLRLVEASEERGTLPEAELLDVLEPLQLDPLETDTIYRELEKRGIDVVAESPEPEPLPALQLSYETTTDALQLFLREAGRHPLLTAAQEV